MAKRVTLGKPLGGFLVGAGLDELALAGGNVFWANPGSGSDSSSLSDAKSPDHPYATTLEAFDATADAHNDVVLLVAQATGDTLLAAFDWDHSYTHLVGVGGGSVPVSGRARIVGGATTDVADLFTLSGSGCVIKNIQFYNGADASAAAGAMIVSGNRNKLVNCHFAGMGHLTQAAQATSYSLKVTGSENVFKDCTIGLDTVLRGASNVAQLYLGSASAQATRNYFDGCKFLSWSETAGAFFAKIVEADRWNEFHNCTFINFSANHGATLANCFTDIDNFYTHDTIISGNSRLIGCDGWGAGGTYGLISVENVGGASTAGIRVTATT